MCKPPIKWAGGKRQLIDELEKNLPKNFNRYFEPFIGGGALYFHLNKKDSVICDYNEELINMYRTIKDNPNGILKDLREHKKTETYYYDLRAIDRNPGEYDILPKVKKASRFIYLNKMGFNGLYRVNRKGQNNVPYGKDSNRSLADEENIYCCSDLLKNTEILQGDFEKVKPLIQKGDFIYIDPPYVPLNKTSSFTSYTEAGFDLETQIRLKEFCDYIDEVGAYFLLSNSYTEFVLNLYQNYKIVTIQANRSINSDGAKRGKIKEVLVRNYEEVKS